MKIKIYRSDPQPVNSWGFVVELDAKVIEFLDFDWKLEDNARCRDGLQTCDTCPNMACCDNTVERMAKSNMRAKMEAEPPRAGVMFPTPDPFPDPGNYQQDASPLRKLRRLHRLPIGGHGIVIPAQFFTGHEPPDELYARLVSFMPPDLIKKMQDNPPSAEELERLLQGMRSEMEGTIEAMIQRFGDMFKPAASAPASAAPPAPDVPASPEP